jgi:hypothetical protein
MLDRDYLKLAPTYVALRNFFVRPYSDELYTLVRYMMLSAENLVFPRRDQHEMRHLKAWRIMLNVKEAVRWGWLIQTKLAMEWTDEAKEKLTYAKYFESPFEAAMYRILGIVDQDVTLRTEYELGMFSASPNYYIVEAEEFWDTNRTVILKSGRHRSYFVRHPDVEYPPWSEGSEDVWLRSPNRETECLHWCGMKIHEADAVLRRILAMMLRAGVFVWQNGCDMTKGAHWCTSDIEVRTLQKKVEWISERVHGSEIDPLIRTINAISRVGGIPFAVMSAMYGLSTDADSYRNDRYWRNNQFPDLFFENNLDKLIEICFSVWPWMTEDDVSYVDVEGRELGNESSVHKDIIARGDKKLRMSLSDTYGSWHLQMRIPYERLRPKRV